MTSSEWKKGKNAQGQDMWRHTDGRKTYEDPDTVVEAAAVKVNVDIHTPVHTVQLFDVDEKTDTRHTGGTGAAKATHPPLGDCLSRLSTGGIARFIGREMGETVEQAVAYLFASMVIATIIYPFFIMGNDSRTNVFKYPAIQTMLGAADDPNQVRTSCTITSCWSILESNVQSWHVDKPIYDMRQIDKNTYTASTCNSLPANFGPGLPAEANYCDTCGVNQRKNLDYLIWCACLPYVIAASVLGLKLAFDDTRNPPSKTTAVAACVWIWGLFTAMLGMSIKVWQNLAACKNSIKAWFLFVYPAISSGTKFSKGMYIYSWGTVSLGLVYICGSILLAITAANAIYTKMKAAASFDN